MADLQKLDNAIEELEKQSNNLKDFNTVFTEISKLKKEVSDNLILIKDSNGKLNDATKEIKISLDEFSKKIEVFFKDYGRHQKELDESIRIRLDKNKTDITNDINLKLTDTVQKIINTSNDLSRSFDALSQNNIKHQKEIESHLDKNRTEIKVDLRNEGAQIQRALETTIKSAIYESESKMIKELELQRKKVNILMFLIFISIMATTALAVSVFFK